MSVPGQIERHRPELTPAERKVAAVVLADPEAVAFGTVADVARRAGTSGATVVRTATRLGYDGFPALQTSVRQEMATRLRPAAARIRRPGEGDVISRTAERDLANVAATLDGIDRAAFERAVRRLAASSGTSGGTPGPGTSGGTPGPGTSGGTPGPRGRVFVLAGDASTGVALLLAAELGLLRPGVEAVSGSEVHVARVLAGADTADTVVVLDLSRYDRWILDATRRVKDRGVAVIAISDGPLSPLAAVSTVAFTAATAGAGPFDSHTGMLALANALVAAVAERLRRSATERLDAVEAAWSEAGALVDG